MTRNAALLIALLMAPGLAVAQPVPVVSARPRPTLAGMEARYRSVLLKHFKHEPGIRVVQQDAIRYANAEPERARSWFTRSSLANLAPRRVQVRLDRDFRDNKSATSRDRVEVSARSDLDDDSLWQFTVEWDFSRLVFNPDTVRVANEAIDLAELREDVLNAVTKIYFERRAIRMEMLLAPPGDFATFARKRLRVDELTADIDALTGAEFSRRLRLAEKRRAPRKPPARKPRRGGKR